MGYFYHCPYVGVALINILRSKKKKKENVVYVVCVTVYVDLISLTRPPWHKSRDKDNLKRKHVFFSLIL
jgi:hypothetical protein